MTAIVPARATFPELARLDAAIGDLLPTMPGYHSPTHEFLAWNDRARALNAERNRVLAEISRLLCSRCSGTGELPQFGHRHGGICYQCKGDGWSAAGRRRNAKAGAR